MSELLAGHSREACSVAHPAPGLTRAAWQIDGLD